MKQSLLRFEQGLDDFLDRNLRAWHGGLLVVLSVVVFLTENSWRGKLDPLIIWGIGTFLLVTGLALQSRGRANTKKPPVSFRLWTVIMFSTLAFLAVVAMLAETADGSASLGSVVLIAAAPLVAMAPLMLVAKYFDKRRVGRAHTLSKTKLFK